MILKDDNKRLNKNKISVKILSLLFAAILILSNSFSFGKEINNSIKKPINIPRNTNFEIKVAKKSYKLSQERDNFNQIKDLVKKQIKKFNK